MKRYIWDIAVVSAGSCGAAIAIHFINDRSVSHCVDVWFYQTVGAALCAWSIGNGRKS